MSVVERLASHNRADIASTLDGYPLQHALKALRIAQRILANGAADLAAPHVQLALDLLEPLAVRPAACALLPIDGGRLASNLSRVSAVTAKVAS